MINWFLFDFDDIHSIYDVYDIYLGLLVITVGIVDV